MKFGYISNFLKILLLHHTKTSLVISHDTVFSGSCGPASCEAVRKGDVGCSDDTDAFYSSLNAYVRYYFEDEGSEWGFSPFRQYRYVLTSHIYYFSE